MKTIEQAIKAIDNRINRIITYQDNIEKLIIVDNHFSDIYFEQEAIKGELISLLEYLKEPTNGTISN